MATSLHSPPPFSSPYHLSPFGNPGRYCLVWGRGRASERKEGEKWECAVGKVWGYERRKKRMRRTTTTTTRKDERNYGKEGGRKRRRDITIRGDMQVKEGEVRKRRTGGHQIGIPSLAERQQHNVDDARWPFISTILRHEKEKRDSKKAMP